MKAQELVGKTQDELKDTLMQLRKEQFTLRMQHVSGQLTSPAKLRTMRRDIARVKTAMNGGLTASVKPAAKKETKKATETKSAAAPKKADAKKAPAKKTTTKKAAPKKADAKKTEKKDK